MAAGLSNDLIWIGVVTWFLGFYLAKPYLQTQSALGVAFAKTAIPFGYFAWFSDGSWTFFDDITYFESGSQLLHRGVGPLSALFDKDDFVLLLATSGGDHVLYQWFNLLAQYLFGEYYFSPVFLNVLATFICGNILYRILLLSGFASRYAKSFLVFFLFHWDVVVWSSLVNLKDTLVMTMTVAAFYLVLLVSVRATVARISWLGLIIFLFFWVRFYIPIVIVAACAVWAASVHVIDARRVTFIFLIFVGATLIVDFLGFENIQERLADIQFGGFAYGLIRIALTPRPWGISGNYSFLLVPSILHWLMFFPAILGAIMLWRESRTARLLLIYLIMGLLLYGSVEELLGPRQRLQVTFIIAWAQFHFLWRAINSLVDKPGNRLTDGVLQSTK